MTQDALTGVGMAGSKPRTASERIVRALNRTPVHIALGLVALVWLAPTIGLLITSFRPRGDIQSSGWTTTGRCSAARASSARSSTA